MSSDREYAWYNNSLIGTAAVIAASALFIKACDGCMISKKRTPAEMRHEEEMTQIQNQPEMHLEHIVGDNRPDLFYVLRGDTAVVTVDGSYILPELRK